MLTNENYYTPKSNQKYMSFSQFKDFLKCEAMAMATIRGEWRRPASNALLVGSYVDAYFEGTLNLFQAQNPDIFKRDGTLKCDYVQANQIIQRIENDVLFMEYLQGDKQTIMTADLFGCAWKIKMDVYHSERIVDLKIMRSLEPVMGKSFIEYWMYDLQMAAYGAVEGKGKETYLAVATKEDYTDMEIIHVPKWRKDECLEWAGRQMPKILEVKTGIREPERCGICDYCRSTKILTGPVDFQDVGISTIELKRLKGEY